ncbi:MAG: OmpA family protein [Spirochaetales bacterium]|nr:OmpA family protein [Spirochaetales bacterium]
MKRIFPAIAAVFLVASPLMAREFRFTYSPGDRYRIHSQVDESVYVNGVYSHTADILNKISIEVADEESGSGLIKAWFQTSERSYASDSVYEWAREYYSEFWRDEVGRYRIDESYFMPVVRSVPQFPERDLAPGDTWTAAGSEVHDFRDNFGIPDAFHFPIQVSYLYSGTEELDGQLYDLIEISYTVFFRQHRAYKAEMYPVMITGYSDQLLYWDFRLGRPHHYSEEFDFIFTFNTGDAVEYTGVAEATVHATVAMDKEQVAEEIRNRLDESQVENTEVSVDDAGVTVSIENIQFLPDSAVLVEREIEKLNVIAEILEGYPERDILITGHTAMAGTAAGRQALSEERAKAVGNYLLRLGVRDPSRIITRGLGGTQPVADNSTEEGMSRNRRVEITILEN